MTQSTPFSQGLTGQLQILLVPLGQSRQSQEEVTVVFCMDLCVAFCGAPESKAGVPENSPLHRTKYQYVLLLVLQQTFLDGLVCVCHRLCVQWETLDCLTSIKDSLASDCWALAGNQPSKECLTQKFTLSRFALASASTFKHSTCKHSLRTCLMPSTELSLRIRW